ncbi:sulfite exporter TauE/SafE family protein [Sulfobacillus harzensis]|uniref:Probable membrane transporter protein n=1 Tax=Sulfobacillus harzensis TaxID=2729629 RepID=A0A7Y0Q1Y4_9FIRM|nr:sulfite exporter TauE/SafE family protein [Sulfobacillus harzensis]NMP21932.1 sulfite exporter TauE/SafE family protein [Sulfobacillus harzensis]
MSVEQSILSVISGGIVGLILGLLGGGGSILAVPLLLYLVRLRNPHVVIGTSALAVSVNAFFNLFTHAREGHVRWKPALGFSIPGIVGAFVGSELGKRLHGATLLFLFAILMLVIAGLMLRRAGGQRPAAHPEVSRVSQEAGDTAAAVQPASRVQWPKVIGAGFLVGALSGFFGIGGGFLIVPALVFAVDLSFIEAIGSSLLAVGLFGLTTAVTYSLAGLINWLAFVEFIAGGAIGGILGTRLATRLSQRRAALNYIFSGVIVLVAIYMLYKNALALHL